MSKTKTTRSEPDLTMTRLISLFTAAAILCVGLILNVRS